MAHDKCTIIKLSLLFNNMYLIMLTLYQTYMTPLTMFVFWCDVDFVSWRVWWGGNESLIYYYLVLSFCWYIRCSSFPKWWSFTCLFGRFVIFPLNMPFVLFCFVLFFFFYTKLLFREANLIWNGNKSCCHKCHQKVQVWIWKWTGNS